MARETHTNTADKDVLYLMIVDMPSDAEMAAAMSATEGQRPPDM